MKFNKKFIIDTIALILISLFMIFIIFIIFLGIITSRYELSKCVEKLGYKTDFLSWIGSINYPVNANYVNETNIVCCYNNPVLSSEGALIHKCYFVDR